MQKYLLYIVVVMILQVAALTVQAKTFVDECDSMQGSTCVGYSGFSKKIDDFSALSGWMDCVDTSVLSMNGQRASVVYTVSGAERIRVSIYAENSTLAVPLAAGGFRLGIEMTDVLSQAQRCYYDNAQDRIFAMDATSAYQLKLARAGLLFFPMNQPPSPTGEYYGLNLAVSVDGKNYIPLPRVIVCDVAAQSQEQGNGAYYRESYTAALPPNTVKVRVTLCGYRRLAGQGMPDMLMPEHVMQLAQVAFEGEKLHMGPPPKPEPDPPPQEESSLTQQASSAASLSPQNQQPDDTQDRPPRRYSRSDSYDMRGDNRDRIDDTYNGNGDTRAAIRSSVAADAVPYTSVRPKKQEKSSSVPEYTAVVVHTTFSERVKTEKRAASPIAAFSGAAFLWMAVQGLFKLRR